MYVDKKMYVFRSFWDREDCHRALTDSLKRSKRRVRTGHSRSNSPNVGADTHPLGSRSNANVQAALLSDGDHTPRSGVGVEIDEDPNQSVSRVSNTSKKSSMSDPNDLDDETEESGESISFCFIINKYEVYL